MARTSYYAKRRNSSQQASPTATPQGASGQCLRNGKIGEVKFEPRTYQDLTIVWYTNGQSLKMTA